MTTLNGERASRSGSIEELRRALQEAVTGAEVDVIERRLDAIQKDLRARWAADDAAAPMTATARRWP